MYNSPVLIREIYKGGSFVTELVKDIMEKNVYYAKTEDLISDVLTLLADKKVSGVPVLNEDQTLCGFISDGDIMKFIAKQDPRIIDMTSFVTVWYDVESFDKKLEDLLKTKVAELATKKVVVVKPDDSIDDAARVLGKRKIKKVPVVDDNQHVLGILSRSIIIRYIVTKHLTVNNLEEK